MKVLHIANDFEFGGLQNYLFLILKGLKGEKIQCGIVAVAGIGKFEKNFKNLNIPVKYFDCIIRIGKYIRFINIINVIKLAIWIKKSRFDIVNTHLFLGGLIGRTAAILAGVKCIFHTVHSTYYWKKFYHLIFDRILFLFTKKVICDSNTVREFTIKQWKVSPEKFIVIHTGIDIDKFNISSVKKKVIRKSLGIKKNEKVIISTGRLYKTKRFPFLIDIFYEVVKQCPQTRLIIAGDGPEYKLVVKKIKELNLEQNVIMTGYIENIEKLLPAGDIFVLPTEVEGCPLSFIEAMASKIPVVGSDIPALREVVSKNNGVLCQLDDKKCFVWNIVKILNNKRLLHLLGKNGYKIAKEKFYYKSVIGKLTILYRGCKNA